MRTPLYDRFAGCNFKGYSTEQDFKIETIERLAIEDAKTNNFKISDRTKGCPSEYRVFYDKAYKKAGGLTPVELKKLAKSSR